MVPQYSTTSKRIEFGIQHILMLKCCPGTQRLFGIRHIAKGSRGQLHRTDGKLALPGRLLTQEKGDRKSFPAETKCHVTWLVWYSSFLVLVMPPGTT